jgi:hypothetical protein
MKKIILFVTIVMIAILLSALAFYCGRREGERMMQQMERR